MNALIKKLAAILLVFVLTPSISVARIEAYEFDTVEQEETYKVLIEELRCLVCQNNNLADSNADLAKDLRVETYDLVQKGNSRDEVVDYMVARYGDFVVYRPPVKASTFLLWFGPFILLVIVLFMMFRRYKKPPAADKAESKQAEKAKDLLSD